MTVNFSGPYQLRLNYTCGTATYPGLVHQARFHCDVDSEPDVGEDYAVLLLKTSSAGTLSLANAVDSLIPEFAAFLNSTYGTIDSTEFWKYTPGTEQATWITARTEGDAGTSAVVAWIAGQMQMVFRTEEGGVLKINIMEGVIPYGPVIRPVDFTADMTDLADEVLKGVSTWVLGKDTSYPIAVLGVYPSSNAQVFARRNR